MNGLRFRALGTSIKWVLLAGLLFAPQSSALRAHAQRPRASERAEQAVWTVSGEQSHSRLGYSAGTAGDVNGDGYADLVVGAPYYDGEQQDVGRAYVYYGSASGLSPSADWTVEGDQSGAHMGYSVGTAGDVNGDGYADLVVGAENYDGTQENAGRVYVYHGSASGLSTSADWIAESDRENARLGWSAGTAGDVNGDGYADLIVGAVWYEDGQEQEGRAYLYYGSASGLSATPNWVAESDEALAWFGYSVGTAGDVNGDGYADLVVGAPQPNRVHVYLGSASGPSALADWIVTGDASDVWFGYSVGTAGDVNGDGYADLAVGATFSGRAYVYHGSASGLSMTPNWVVESDQPDSRFGESVGTAGDVNGDGYADLVVGEFGFEGGQVGEGRIHVYHGSTSGLSTSAAWTAESDHESAGLGWSVGTVGDVDGDGYADLVAGAPHNVAGGSEIGRAYVYHGSASGLSASVGWAVEGGQQGEHLGYAVGTAGDVNGDGYADVVVGAPDYNGEHYAGGLVALYYGSATGLSTTPAWSVEGERDHAHLGYAVGAAGDVNGDGYADLAVGAPDHDGKGRVYVYYGGATGPAAEAAWTADGTEIYGYFGRSTGTAGDVNGDGYADIFVGELGYGGGQESVGRVYVYHGGSAGLTTTAAWIAEGDREWTWFGWSASSAGDVNGDGYADLIVGAPGYDSVEWNEGRAYVYHGSASGLSATADWFAGTEQLLANFGQSVGAAGDVNGDGYADVVVGVPYYDVQSEDGTQRNKGRAYVYYGSSMGLSDTAAWSADGDQAWAEFGYAVGPAGDVNGDGYADLAVGAPNCDSGGVQEKSRAHVYHGSAAGLSAVTDWGTESLQDCTRLGRSVGTAGDVNGDGYADLIAGAPEFDVEQWHNEGRAALFYGGAGPGLSLNPRQRRDHGLAPIAPLGKATFNAFRLVALGRTPFGRGKVKLEWEVKPLEVPFDGEGTGQSAAWSDAGVSGVELDELVHDLQAETPYHWRLRLRYHPTTTPFQQTSRWLTVPWNGWSEQDLRTGAPLRSSIYLPMVSDDSASD